MYAWCEKYNKIPNKTTKDECNKEECRSCLFLNILHELADYQPSFRIDDSENESKI